MLKNNWSPGALVFAGSGLGGVSRLVVVMAWPASLHGYAWGILGVNLIGCFLIGFLGQRMLAAGKEENKAFVQVFWITGFCGGFTTVSIFSRQTLALGEILSPELSLLYLGGHLLFCPLMVVGGMVLAKHGASKGGQDR